jgi:hypothetical protein
MRRSAGFSARVRSLVRAIQDNDATQIEAAILRLSQSRRLFAPLGLAVGAFVLLFDAVRLLVSNWRLTLVQILPAMWIWLAMLDLKAHVLHGKSFHALRGPILIPIDLVIVAITVASFFLNAVFAYAIAGSRPPKVRPAVQEARRHLSPIIVSGAIVGALLAFSTTVVTRWGKPWFGISLGIVVGVMMICYVAIPSRTIGVQPASGQATSSRRDKLTTTAMSGLLGTIVCTPPYLLGRIGILMLGSEALLIPGIIVMIIAFGLQSGATGAVRAIKVSTKLVAGRDAGDAVPRSPATTEGTR